MYALPDWRNRFPRIQQQGECWCIPACFENVLKYSGFSFLSQGDLALDYCKKYGDDALLKIINLNPLQVVPVSIKGFSDQTILQVAKQCAFKHGNFSTFAEPVCQNIDFRKTGLSLDLKENINSKSDYFAEMAEALKHDRPVLISVNNGNDTFHIQAVLEVESDNFTTYDPATDKIEPHDLANCRFSTDLIVLK
jgi:hypothetical protein